MSQSKKTLQILDELLDAYAEDLAIAEYSFEMMGKMLDQEYLRKRLELSGIHELYIYGGEYLGIQFYRACCRIVDILSVVDRKGCLRIHMVDIPVMDFEGLKEAYRGEYIVITPVRYYREIQRDLLSFAPENRILFLGELLGGAIS